MKTWFASVAQREAAIEALTLMPRATRKLLEQIVETQGITRQTLSGAANQLHDNGLIFYRRPRDWEPWRITPSLYGEEALLRLEIRERKAARRKD